MSCMLQEDADSNASDKLEKCFGHRSVILLVNHTLVETDRLVGLVSVHKSDIVQRHIRHLCYSSPVRPVWLLLDTYTTVCVWSINVNNSPMHKWFISFFVVHPGLLARLAWHLLLFSLLLFWASIHVSLKTTPMFSFMSPRKINIFV